MKTTKENFKRDLHNLLEGYVVACSDGLEFIASDINNPETYVFCDNMAKRSDWPLTDLTIQQDILYVPDENGSEIERLCRYSLNNDCLNPFTKGDFHYVELFDNQGFIEINNQWSRIK